MIASEIGGVIEVSRFKLTFELEFEILVMKHRVGDSRGQDTMASHSAWRSLG